MTWLGSAGRAVTPQYGQIGARSTSASSPSLGTIGCSQLETDRKPIPLGWWRARSWCNDRDMRVAFASVAVVSLVSLPALLEAGATDFTLGHPPLPPEPALGHRLAEIVAAFRVEVGR